MLLQVWVKAGPNILVLVYNTFGFKIPPTPPFQRGEISSPPLLKGDLGGFSDRIQSEFVFSASALAALLTKELSSDTKNIETQSDWRQKIVGICNHKRVQRYPA